MRIQNLEVSDGLPVKKAAGSQGKLCFQLLLSFFIYAKH